jgi:hypothetical protein
MPGASFFLLQFLKRPCFWCLSNRIASGNPPYDNLASHAVYGRTMRLIIVPSNWHLGVAAKEI